MPDTGFLAVFLIGLLGGTHCVGMCGGIVAALSGSTVPGARLAWPLHLAYNCGRIFSYTVAGALMGALGDLGLLFDELLPVQMVFFVAANLMLVALGLYLMGVTRFLTPIEQLGAKFWKYLQPIGRRFLPAKRIGQALPLGMVWGWLPCGLVYSVLSTALLTGSAQGGALLMLVFGLGTLPTLLLAGAFAAGLKDFMRNQWVRRGAGLTIIAFGLWGLMNATTLGEDLWNGIVCHT